MLLLKDIVGRVQFKLDDPDGTYITPEYVLGFVNDVYEWLFNKLSLTGSQFSEEVVILPAVAAGTPDLSQFQAVGQPLASLITPTMLRWRQPNLDATYFRKADGPLDAPRDLPPNLPGLDSWAFVHYVVKLSQFSTALDLEVTGTFLFDPLTEMDDSVQIAMNANRCFPASWPRKSQKDAAIRLGSRSTAQTQMKLSTTWPSESPERARPSSTGSAACEAVDALDLPPTTNHKENLCQTY
jgi:hypothetical protein